MLNTQERGRWIKVTGYVKESWKKACDRFFRRIFVLAWVVFTFVLSFQQYDSYRRTGKYSIYDITMASGLLICWFGVNVYIYQKSKIESENDKLFLCTTCYNTSTLYQSSGCDDCSHSFEA